MKEKSILIRARLRRRLKSLTELFGKLGFSKVSLSSDRLVVEKVEGTYRGKSSSFWRLVFKKDSIELSFTMPSSGELYREVKMMRLFLDVLKLLEHHYTIEASQFYPFVSLLEKVERVVSEEHFKISADYERLKDDFGRLKKQFEAVVKKNEEQAIALSDLKKTNEVLGKRVEMLMGMTDDELRREVYDWIESHDGKIDVRTFANLKKIQPSRVEEIIETLLREGYIKEG